jgi:hypothetical protein
VARHRVREAVLGVRWISYRVAENCMRGSMEQRQRNWEDQESVPHAARSRAKGSFRPARHSAYRRPTVLIGVRSHAAFPTGMAGHRVRRGPQSKQLTRKRYAAGLSILQLQAGTCSDRQLGLEMPYQPVERFIGRFLRHIVPARQRATRGVGCGPDVQEGIERLRQREEKPFCERSPQGRAPITG